MLNLVNRFISYRRLKESYVWRNIGSLIMVCKAQGALVQGELAPDQWLVSVLMVLFRNSLLLRRSHFIDFLVV